MSGKKLPGDQLQTESGRREQLARALDASPQDTALVLQLIVSLASENDFEAAEQGIAALNDPAARAEGWLLLSRIHRAMQRWSLALAAIESAQQYQPQSHALRLEHALILGEQSRLEESLHELQALARDAGDSPELIAHLAQVLQAAGRTQEAETRLETAIRRWPTHAQLHQLLARLRWRRGLGE
ncbi:MAG TPA: tetratricopeptide repeat protein, partial [Povalibacter sp.]|nr:tetratricopeptide repeat protein [Povalibacter sp.]